MRRSPRHGQAGVTVPPKRQAPRRCSLDTCRVVGGAAWGEADARVCGALGGREERGSRQRLGPAPPRRTGHQGLPPLCMTAPPKLFLCVRTRRTKEARQMAICFSFFRKKKRENRFFLKPADLTVFDEPLPCAATQPGSHMTSPSPPQKCRESLSCRPRMGSVYFSRRVTESLHTTRAAWHKCLPPPAS